MRLRPLGMGYVANLALTKMKKITELTEVRTKTTHVKDAYGNRQKLQEEYIAPLEIKSASPGQRFGHLIFDGIVFQIVIYLVTYAYTKVLHQEQPDPFTSGFWLLFMLNLVVSWGLLLALYTFCEYKWQKTPGKFLTKTVVIDEYGNRPELNTLIVRSLIRLVPFEAFTFFDTYSHGWHDKWSKTWVVPEEELTEIKRIQAEQSESAEGVSEMG